jgi:hypothetical protein
MYGKCKTLTVKYDMKMKHLYNHQNPAITYHIYPTVLFHEGEVLRVGEGCSIQPVKREQSAVESSKDLQDHQKEVL